MPVGMRETLLRSRGVFLAEQVHRRVATLVVGRARQRGKADHVADRVHVGQGGLERGG